MSSAWRGHRCWIRSLGWVGLVALLAAPALPRLPLALAQSPRPLFEPAPCPMPLPDDEVEGRTAICGYDLVPEDRARPDSPTIRLAVLILKSSAADPAPGPVFYLAGGPGGSGLSDNRDPSAWAEVRRQRDVIVFDQRGAGSSRPSLACSEPADIDTDANPEDGLDPSASLSAELTAFAACRQRLTQTGIDPSAYNSTSNAADVDDLRRILGYQTINLYGISYGTRLAQFVMRAYPETVRAAVIDGVVPNDLRVSDNIATISAAQDRFFQTCAADPACTTAYPNLAATFRQTVADLNAHPLEWSTTNRETGAVKHLTLTGDRLLSELTTYLYAPEHAWALLVGVAALQDGNDELAAQIFGPVLVNDDFSQTSLGMYYSVTCQEMAPLDSPARLAEAAIGRPAGIAAAYRSFLPICDLWTVPAAPADVNAPLRASIPTLLFSGEYDPVTPAAFAGRVAAGLPKSYRFEFPGLGHGAFSKPCPNSLLVAFLDDPSQRPDASCLAEMPALSLLPPPGLADSTPTE